VRRHDNVAFMGGAHVFPGGRVDAADRLADPAALCDGVETAAARMPDLEPAQAVAHHVAALRELFEEAGVLLARDNAAEMSSPRRLIVIHGDAADRFREYREALAGVKTTLPAVAERERLRLALDAITPFAHWVTPEIEIKRYDTRFFVAAAPDSQDAVHDDRETTGSVWLDPADAVEQCRRGAIALPPPTWTTLRALDKFSSVDAVMRWARDRTVVRIEPGFVGHGEGALLTLPGDPLYPPVPGFDTPAETRFVLENGRWRPTTA
jgi:8-oxo-dGTP pyrophosphatase MutT (NUDIX family)